MKNVRVSNTQKSLYSACPQKHYYRYKKKMREKAKGSALPFGVSFDQSSDVLFHDRDLSKAIERFDEIWMASEGNLNVKFSKSDLDTRIYQGSDISALEASAVNLNDSKPKQGFDKDGDVVKLVKEIKKLKENGYVRDLTKEEEYFLHYAHILCMRRKGHLMLKSFYDNILPHITEVISSQMKVDIKNPDGDTIIGYIDLVCKMAGYKLPNGRVLTENDVVVADVKTAGAAYWSKLDDLDNSDQLDTYLASPQIQELGETNVIAYMAVSKQVSKTEKQYCGKCSNEKTSRHKTCDAEIDGSRCNGEWVGDVDYYSEAKIVIGERDLDRARKVYNDYDGIVRAIKSEIYFRNRDSCNMYGSICPYKSVCDKCLTPEEEDKAIQDWKDRFGE